MIRVDLDRATQRDRGLVQTAVPFEGQTEVVLNVGHVGLQRRRRLEGDQRLGVFPALQTDEAEQVVGLRGGLIESDARSERGSGFVDAAEVVLRPRQLVESRRVFGVDGQCALRGRSAPPRGRPGRFESGTG